MTAEELARELGEELSARRKELGITQAQLASRTGVSKRTIASIEAGNHPQVTLGRLVPICNELELQFCFSRRGTTACAEGETPNKNEAAMDQCGAIEFESRRQQLIHSTDALSDLT